MRKYVIMGAQAAARAPRPRSCADAFDLVHIGVGDMLRWNVQFHTKLGAQVRRTMVAGGLRRATSWSSRWSATGWRSTTGTTAS